jgi:hypothetical protein
MIKTNTIFMSVLAILLLCYMLYLLYKPYCDKNWKCSENGCELVLSDDDTYETREKCMAACSKQE